MGLFTYRQALDGGMTKHELVKAVEEGDLKRVLRNVYATSDEIDSVELRAAAVRLLRPDGTVVLCLRSATWLHGLDVLPPQRTIADWPLQLVVPSGHVPPRLEGCKGYQAPLDSIDTTEICGVRVTTSLRTSLDCGRLLPRLEAQAAVDQFVRRDPGLVPGILELAEEYRGRRGGKQLRGVALLTDPRVESPGESWTRVVLVAGGLPAPEPQVPLADATGHIWARIDNGYEEQGIGIEYDGLEFHDGRERADHDHRRRERIEREHGWTIIVARREHIWRDSAEFLIGIWNTMLQNGYDGDPPSEEKIQRLCAQSRRTWRGSEYL